MSEFERILDILIEKCTHLGLSLVGAILVLAIGLPLVSMINKRLKRKEAFRHLDRSVASFLAGIIHIALITLVVMIAAFVLGIPTSSVVALIASCGVAIGLALQGALGNFAGGLIILISKPFRVGDYITASGYSGTVRSISVFYTTIVTEEKETVTLPNGSLTGGAVVNHSCEPYRRMEFSFSASYGTDIDLVLSTLDAVANSYRHALPEPHSFGYVREHGDSGVKYGLFVFVKWENYWDTLFEIPGLVKKAFDEKGIEIPFPQIDVHNR